MGWIREKLAAHLHEIAQTKTSVHSIAMGFAIGVFIAILPTPGFNILIGLLIVFVLPRINKYSLFIAMAFFNPLITAPFYYLSYRIGDMLFGSAPIIKYDIVIIDTIYNFSRRFLIGNAILAVSIALLMYLIVHLGVLLYRRNHIQSLRRK